MVGKIEGKWKRYWRSREDFARSLGGNIWINGQKGKAGIHFISDENNDKEAWLHKIDNNIAKN